LSYEVRQIVEGGYLATSGPSEKKIRREKK